MEDIKRLMLGDVGTTIKIRVVEDDLPVDVSACTSKQIIFEKPDTSVVTKDAEFTTDGSDGYIEYVTVSGDLDQTGLWSLQGYIQFTTQAWHTTIDRMLVSDNLGE